jgi:hypothetical protein
MPASKRLAALRRSMMEDMCRLTVRAEPQALSGGLVGEAAEVLSALWAHALPGDGLEHASCRAECDRVDLLLHLLTLTSRESEVRSAWHRADDLPARWHQASPLLKLRCMPPGDAA